MIFPFPYDCIKLFCSLVAIFSIKSSSGIQCCIVFRYKVEVKNPWSKILLSKGKLSEINIHSSEGDITIRSSRVLKLSYLNCEYFWLMGQSETNLVIKVNQNQIASNLRSGSTPNVWLRKKNASCMALTIQGKPSAVNNMPNTVSEEPIFI